MDATAPRSPGCAGLCTPDGFAAAHRDHRRMLRRRAQLVLGDSDLAEDAVQEAFLRAWRACARFDATRPERLGSWLTAITRNVAIDMARARAARPGSPTTDPDGPAGPVQGDPADTVVDRTVLRAALTRISGDQRAAILATIVHGHQYGSAATVLRVPEGTVKSRVFHGLRLLRTELSPVVPG